jgi:hypothetical protein
LNNTGKIKNLGKLLYAAIFTEPINGHFREQAWRKMIIDRSQKTFIRLRLIFQKNLSPEIVNLPWEFLYGQENYLSTHPGIALSYEFEDWMAAPVEGYPVEDLPLRVLLVHTHPHDQDGVGVIPVRQAVENLQKDMKAEFKELVDPSPKALQEKLGSYRPHIFHFLGHGKFEETSGAFALLDKEGKALWYDDESFAELFAAWRPRLVLLQSCEGGQMSSLQYFVGGGAWLVRRHIPAVVAMRYPFTQAVGWKFSRVFYNALVEEKPIDVAVQCGRNALALPQENQSHSTREFATPMLWMQFRDGCLFSTRRTALESKDEYHGLGRKKRLYISNKGQGIMIAFLKALISDTSELDPGGIRHTYKKATKAMPLDEIYIGLKADRDLPDVDRRVMQEELEDIKIRLEQIDDAKERERQYQIWATQARAIQHALKISEGEHVELSNIIQRFRQLVILGDPGSGKTTLLRYLALRFARSILDNVDRLFEERDWWDNENIWSLTGIGPVRLPLLVRISKYAEARNPKQGGDPDLTLADYLSRYFVGYLQLPCTAEELAPLLRRCLDAGRCIVLLDGLDEIIDPADRRNIAVNINRFAVTFGASGLPQLTLKAMKKDQPLGLASMVSIYDTDVEEDDYDDILDDWDPDNKMTNGIRRQWKKRWKKIRASGRVRMIVSDLLRDANYAHLGNRFVVTSRIAGYHFARISGDFEHFTICPMDIGEIEKFLKKWCPVAERRIAEYPENVRVEQRAQQEIKGIMKAVKEIPGVRRMAQNPLLLRILAIIHRNERHLPQRRIELYETATITLLRDWSLERGLGKEVVIDEDKAMGLLGPTAYWIHENRPSGLLTKGEVEIQLCGILAREQGQDPQNPSFAVKAAVHDFLDKIRQYSGIFIEQGEGLFGFMHLTFEEYFTARHMVSLPTEAQKIILELLHQPRWREPTLLAVGFMSKNFYRGTHDLLRALLDHNSEYEEILHRDLLFSAACVGDSVNVAPVLIQDIAGKLIAIYMDRRNTGRFRRLREQVKDALLMLNNDQGSEAVEAALAEMISTCTDSDAVERILDAAEWLNPRTSGVAKALEKCKAPVVFYRARKLLRQIKKNITTDEHPNTEEWDGHRGNRKLALLLGALWLYGWNTALRNSLAIPSQVSSEIEIISWKVFQALYEFSRAKPVSNPENIKKLEQIRRELMDEFSNRRYIFDLRMSKELGDIIGLLDDNYKPEQELENIQEGTRLWFTRWMPSLKNRNFPGDLPSILNYLGDLILKNINSGDRLVTFFVSSTDRLIHLEPTPDLEIRLKDNLNTIQSDLVLSFFETLYTTEEAQSYVETVLFLYDTNRENRQKVVECLLKDLQGDCINRLRWALLVLRNRISDRKLFNAEMQGILMSLLEGPTAEAKESLNVLFSLDITHGLLDWCWKTLRQPGHLLNDSVQDRLKRITEIEGTTAILSLLDKGLRDKVLYPLAVKLLDTIDWVEGETLIYTLNWLTDKDEEVRHRASLLISGQENLYNEIQILLINTLREDMKTNVPKSTLLVDHDDKKIKRLLTGMWIYGWKEVIRSLLKSAEIYVPSYREEDTDYLINSLLTESDFNQSFAPLFQEAAQQLARLEQGKEGDVQGEKDISKVMESLSVRLLKNAETAVLLPLKDLRRVLADKNHSLNEWISNQLGKCGLCVNPKPSQLIGLLTGMDKNIPIAAGLALLAFDLHMLLLPPLVEAVQSPDDRVRMKAIEQLENVCEDLPTDGSSDGVEWLMRKYMEFEKKKSGYLGTVAESFAMEIKYETPILVSRWLKAAADDKNPNNKIACKGLENIKKAPPGSGNCSLITWKIKINPLLPVNMRYMLCKEFLEIRNQSVRMPAL